MDKENGNKGYSWKKEWLLKFLWQKVNYGGLQLKVYSEIAKRILNVSNAMKQ